LRREMRFTPGRLASDRLPCWWRTGCPPNALRACRPGQSRSGPGNAVRGERPAATAILEYPCARPAMRAPGSRRKDGLQLWGRTKGYERKKASCWRKSALDNRGPRQGFTETSCPVARPGIADRGRIKFRRPVCFPRPKHRTAAPGARSRTSRFATRLERACGCFGAYCSPPASIAPR
jgi:hypothetical protein